MPFFRLKRLDMRNLCVTTHYILYLASMLLDTQSVKVLIWSNIRTVCIFQSLIEVNKILQDVRIIEYVSLQLLRTSSFDCRICKLKGRRFTALLSATSCRMFGAYFTLFWKILPSRGWAKMLQVPQRKIREIIVGCRYHFHEKTVSFPHAIDADALHSCEGPNYCRNSRKNFPLRPTCTKLTNEMRQHQTVNN